MTESPVACREHPDQAVVGACAQCGRPMCFLCARSERCVECFEGALRQQLDGELSRTYRQLATALALHGLVLPALAVLTHWPTWPVTAALLVPLWACAAGVWLIRRFPAAATSAAIEALVFGYVAFDGIRSGRAALALLLLLPAGMAFRAMRVRTLERARANT